MQPLVIIPARGGSKGVPRKNIKLLNGKPLIYYTIEEARLIFDDKKIIVSTEDNEIKEIVEKIGLKVPFLRPLNLATDKTSTYEVLLDTIKQVEKSGYVPDTIILLQPTSPFRSSVHIQSALKMYENNSDVDMVTSVKETKANPYYSLYEEDKKGYLNKSKNANFTRRQDCPKVWELNGAIYIINKKSLLEKPINLFSKIIKYEMDYKSSIDIDTELDFEFAAFLLQTKKCNK
ncbi:MAG TPA: acylneuraminate cytidylyltransferase family protein [Vicingaceae bacterium]